MTGLTKSAAAYQKPKTIPRICEACGAVFLAVPYEVKRGGAKFCSRQCQRHHQALLNATSMRDGLTRAQRMAAWKVRTPQEVHRAHNIVEQAILNGLLVRRPCEVCGVLHVDAHHDDYSKPLEVRWLCRKHHLLHHRRGGSQ